MSFSLPPAFHQRLERILSLQSQSLWHEFTEEVSTLFILIIDSNDSKIISTMQSLFKELISPLLGNLSLMVWIKLALLAATTSTTGSGTQSSSFIREEIMDKLNKISSSSTATTSKSTSLSIPKELGIRVVKLYLALQLFAEGDNSAVDAWNIIRYEEFNSNSIRDVDEGSLLLESQSFLLLRIHWALKDCQFDSLYTLSMDYLKSYSRITSISTLSSLDLKVLLALSPLEPMIENICKGALLSEGCFNFGLLLSMPIWNCPSPLHSLILAMYHGNEASFLDFFSSKNSSSIDPLLVVGNGSSMEPSSSIRQKMCLMKLSASISRHLNENLSSNISFSQIGQFASIPVEEVEFLLIRALSIGIIRGSIEEENSLLKVNWVEPRIISSKEDVRSLIIGLKEWRIKVKGGIEKISSKIYPSPPSSKIEEDGGVAISGGGGGGSILENVCGMIGGIIANE